MYVCMHTHTPYFLYPFIWQRTQVDSIFGLLSIMLQWTWGCSYLFETLIALPLQTYPDVAFPLELYLEVLSYGSVTFKFLRDLHTIFHDGCTNRHSHHLCARAPFSSHPHQHFSSLAILIKAILTRIRWYLIVLLTDISLMISDIEHLFIYLLDIYMSSLEVCLFRFFAHFSIGLFVPCYWLVWIPYRFGVLTS